MNRVLVLALVASAAVGGYFLANPPVELQPASPGVQQTGNINVSGKVLSGHLEATDAAATAQAVVGNATSTSGANYGGLFKTSSDTGTGVRGVANSTSGSANGGTFQSASPAGAGVRGFATAATGVNYGVYGKAVSPDGFAGFFVGRTQTSGDALFARIGIGNVSTPLDHRFHLRDDVEASATGLAWIYNGLSNTTFFAGRRGLVSQVGGSGQYVVGVTATANSNVDGQATGVYGLAAGSGVNYGVYGIAFFGTTSYAGYFNGPLYASSANAGVKAFMIDHPLDPANKVLTHSSVESDQRMDLYRGEVKTDGKGYAVVTVPSWFDALNTDIQYQLTVISEGDGPFVQAMIAQRLNNGSFKIRTSAPRVTVDWQLSGRRHDPVSNRYPLEVERDKVGGEIGKYYEPEAYGKDRSLGMGYMPSKTEPMQATQNPPQRR